MLGNYLQQTTSTDNIFGCIFFSWRFKVYPLKTRTHKMGTLTNSEDPDEIFIRVCNVCYDKIVLRERNTLFLEIMIFDMLPFLSSLYFVIIWTSILILNTDASR